MGKLIDADALIEHLKNDPLFDLVEQYGLTRVIEAEITIDAIPVEWLKDQIEIASSNGEDDYVNAIEWTVMKWQTEVEDGQTD